jgi:hypothetical protein
MDHRFVKTSPPKMGGNPYTIRKSCTLIVNRLGAGM